MKITNMLHRFVLIVFFVALDIHAYNLQITKNVTCRIKQNLYNRILDCSNRGLMELPDFGRVKFHLKNIHEVNFTGNSFETFDLKRLKEFKELKILTINQNRLHTIKLEGAVHLLKKLETLHLNFNEFNEIPTELNKLVNLKEFSIRKNRIKRIRNDTFQGMNHLETIYLFDKALELGDPENHIRVETGAFRQMASLRVLNLLSVEVNIEKFPDLTGSTSLKELIVAGINNFSIPEGFCEQHKNLISIEVWRSNMDKFPSLRKCLGLERISIIKNKLKVINAEAFSGLPRLSEINLYQVQSLPKIHRDTFKNLPSLIKLDLSNYPLAFFPNFQGTRMLEQLYLDNCRLESVDGEFCKHVPRLTTLHLKHNRLNTLPSMSKCVGLMTMNLLKNRITTLDKDTFNGLNKLLSLTLTDNYLKVIPNTLFALTPNLAFLHLSHNMIKEIGPKAFSNISKLELLDISHNLLTHLPSGGLQSLNEIIADGNKGMRHFPTQQDMPHVKRLRLDYHYHCCFFLRRVQQIHHRYITREMRADSKFEFIGKSHEKYSESNALIEHFKNQSSTPLVDSAGNDVDPMLKILQALNNHTTIFVHKPPDEEEKQTIEHFFDDDGYCTPTPNDFYPCEDLMGREWLRVCVWVVFFLAVFGNIVVLFVLFSNYSKLDVPRFLVLNLAMADLLLGIYLGFLAFVDLKTIGDFRSYGLKWQQSGSCKFAGFLAVFSSELSVFTLTTITMERFLTIKNSMYVDKRLTKNQAFIIMAFGWLFSAFIATLPLIDIGGVKINDYSKYSVCLPFEKDTLPSRIYLILLLGLNLLAFVIILFCYVKIYLFIRNSQAWNSGDSRVARRMAILVFTDFLCWFPIALVALSAVFENPFITDLWISKVITIFVFPVNACANPFLYAIFTKQFRKDIIVATRHIRDKMTNRREIRKSLLKLPIKGSLTYSTSVRRESACSFLFSRRHSSKLDSDSKNSRNTPVMQPSFQQSFEEPDEDNFQERLTTV